MTGPGSSLSFTARQLDCTRDELTLGYPLFSQTKVLIIVPVAATVFQQKVSDIPAGSWAFFNAFDSSPEETIFYFDLRVRIVEGTLLHGF